MSRNEIFNKAGGTPPVPSMMKETQSQLSQELGFDIPVETVPLPSLGKVYPENHPLHMSQTVLFGFPIFIANLRRLIYKFTFI